MNEPRLNLPNRVNATLLAKYFRPHEPVIVLVVKNISSTHPYEFFDRDGRAYMLQWEVKVDGHVMRFPWHLWMGQDAKLANVIMDQHRLPFPLVVLVEWNPESRSEVVVNQAVSLDSKTSVTNEKRYEALADIVKDGALRLKAAAERLKLTEAELRGLLDETECPAELSGPGWVRQKTKNL